MRSIIPPVPMTRVLNDSFINEDIQIHAVDIPGALTGTPVAAAALVANEIRTMQMEYVDEQAVDGGRNVKKIGGRSRWVKDVEEEAEEEVEEDGENYVEEESEYADDMDEQIYTVEKIVKMRIKNGVKEYRVKWLNCPSSDNTWEPENNIFDKDVIINYEKKSKK